jgi:eukaryotic-like serine/threonine-protein kinase
MQPTAAAEPIFKATRMVLGRYDILGVLARGGMGTVYLARHSAEAGFQRLFAVKVLHQHMAEDPEVVEMLFDEARIAAMIHHPNVVPIVDLGSQNGVHYVVMEYIEGAALNVLLRANRNNRPPRFVIPILLDALSGLHAAHVLADDKDQPMNLVHRDVSPQNILVGIDGTARITDFGIAKAESRLNSTRPGQLKGKFAFMSPEQIRENAAVDCRSDVFSAGIVLWTALTGHRLFRADTDAATLTNVLSMRIPPPSTVGLRPPAVFDEICLRALARDPKKRFESAQEMEEHLREAAMAAGLLGGRREVAAWVRTAIGEELNRRRSAIRDVIAQSVGYAPPSAGPVSALRQIATGTDPGSGLSGLSETIVSPASPSQAPTRALGRAPRSRRWLGLLAGALAIAVIATLVRLLSLGAEPEAAAEPPQPVAPAAAPAPEPREPEPVPQAPPAPTEVAVAEPEAPVAPSRPAAVRYRSEPRPISKAAKAAPSKPAAEPAKPRPAWDPDSPLPP